MSADRRRLSVAELGDRIAHMATRLSQPEWDAFKRAVNKNPKRSVTELNRSLFGVPVNDDDIVRAMQKLARTEMQ